METGGSIGFPVGDTYVKFFNLFLINKFVFFFVRIQPKSGRKFLWTILGITIALILVAILFPTIIIVTRTDDNASPGNVFSNLNIYKQIISIN